MWKPIRETCSRATRQETLGHSRRSSLSHCGLILAPPKKKEEKEEEKKWNWCPRADHHSTPPKKTTTKKQTNHNQQKRGREINGQSFSQNPRQKGKSQHRHHQHTAGQPSFFLTALRPGNCSRGLVPSVSPRNQLGDSGGGERGWGVGDLLQSTLPLIRTEMMLCG